VTSSEKDKDFLMCVLSTELKLLKHPYWNCPSGSSQGQGTCPDGKGQHGEETHKITEWCVHSDVSLNAGKCVTSLKFIWIMLKTQINMEFHTAWVWYCAHWNENSSSK
jgi:hypothetical protein